MTIPAMEVPTRRVDMWYAGTSPQSRVTVAFRIILAIPQLIVLYFLFIALFFVIVIGWVGALFMGRLPLWAHGFVSGVVRWATRVGAYLFLLTDRYPPFSLDDAAYPARPIMPPAGGRLNRWSVFFRLILAVPASVFMQIVTYGLTAPLLVVMWFVVLIRGTMPRPLYDAYAALLRYDVRFHSWFGMLTSEYAWGMLGDPAMPAPAAPAAPAAPGTPAAPTAFAPPPTAAPPAYPAFGAPASTTQPFSYPTDGPVEPPASVEPPPPEDAPPERAPAEDAPPQWPPPVPPPPAGPVGVGAMPPPSPWERTVPPLPGAELPPWGRLVLQGAARGWMVFAIVWGAILFVGQNVVQNVIVGHNHHHNTATMHQTDIVVADFNRTDTSIKKALTASRACTTVAGLRSAHLAAAADLTDLADDLYAMNLPANASGQAHYVESDATQLATIFRRLANSASCPTYESQLASSNLDTILSSYPADTQNLVNTLDAD